MISKKVIMSIISIFLIGTGGVGASLALTKIMGKDTQPQLEPTSRFFVINESEIVFGEPAYYRIIVENNEGNNATYDLKVRLAGQEIYNQEIKMNNSAASLNETITLNNISGGYQKLEFLLYKNNEIYKTRVFQVIPVVNYDLAPSLIITPPLLQNSDMEMDNSWKFNGKGFAGGYTSYEWISPERSYQISVYKHAKKDAFGSIIQNFSNKEEGFASLSFDIKSMDKSYYTQALINDEVVWENSSGEDWLRVRVPVFLRKSNKLEFKVIAKNDTNSSMTAWVDNIKFVTYSPEIKKDAIKKEELPYSRKKNGNAVVFKFNTGEKLELNVTEGNVSAGDALYIATNKGNNLTFLGEEYEKISPPLITSVLLPVIENIKDIKLKTGETLKLKNGYAVTLKQIDNQSLKLGISSNNRVVRDIITGVKNSSVDYWKEIDDYKKQKVLQIIPEKIDQGELVLDIIQYDDSKKLVKIGDKYGEFKVINITENSIVMKNVEAIKIETGMETSLMNGKIKIRV
ncbi:S-layer protein [uncultured archaeon]|nr:S-layer protein [uncultured archaeon]